MFDSVSVVILTDISFVFLSALKRAEDWYSLILNQKSIYQFGFKFPLLNKVLCTYPIQIVVFVKWTVEKPNFTVSGSSRDISGLHVKETSMVVVNIVYRFQNLSLSWHFYKSVLLLFLCARIKLERIFDMIIVQIQWSNNLKFPL